MPGENIFDWSKTAANNGTVDSSINWQEGMARADVNNSSRSMMAAHAKHRDLLNGSITTAGTVNAQTFLSGYSPVFTTVPTGMRVLLKIGPGLTNTAAATLSMDGISGAPIKTQSLNELVGGELLAGALCEFVYTGTYWALVTPGGPAITVAIQKFTATGTYTPTPGMVYAIIECWGGGGGGGGAKAVALDLSGGAGGGGAGGYSRARVTAAQVGVSQGVAVGVGGAAANAAFEPGSAGGNTAVGVLCIALGGSGGGGSSGGQGIGGAGGAAGTGDCLGVGGNGSDSTGNFGSLGSALPVGMGGRGANSALGGGGGGGVAYGGSGNGGNATGYAAGGGGGGTNNSLAGGFGGNGSPGYVIITEFIAR